MPNPDGSMTPEERQRALFAVGPTGGAPPDVASPDASGSDRTNQNIQGGSLLPGAYAYASDNGVQNELFGSLSDAQAQVKQQNDFGLGTNNNAATAAMLQNAGATADKFSGQFGADATRAGQLSQQAGARGLGAYAGNTTPYSNALSAAADDRGLQTGAYNQLMAFGNAPQGPSAAQAQLTQATDANTQNALALARSGRGMGGGQAALRQAMAQNATTQQGAAGQMAELRANENTAFQTQRLNAYNAAGGVAGQVAGADVNRATAGLAGAQYQTNTALQGTQLNDAASQAWAAQQQAAQQQAMGAEMGGQTQQLNINASALAGRESQWASANQTHGIDTGNATQAGIADANRTQAYIGAGTAATGAVIAAASDERAKTNIQPLSAVQPLPNTPPPQAASQGGFASKSAADAQQRTATEGAVGGAAGSIAGGAIGSAAGPVGTAVGAAVGNIAGKALGKALSDVRNKENVQPLTALGRGLQAGGSYVKDVDRGADPFAQLQALASKYGAGAVATDPKQADKYAKTPTARFADVAGDAAGVFSRSDHPILSKGDALLADSARNAPPSSYEYKDPRDGQGTFVGPMAQDLARSPVTAPAVGQGPDGKLNVDGSRAALAALSQNHSQQNQLDALYALLDDSKKKELARSSGGLDSAGNPYMQAGAR